MTGKKRLLLFSNSTNFGGHYLGHAGETISNFLGDNIKQLLLIDYAGVTTNPEAYTKKVADALRPFDIQVTGINSEPSAREAIQKAQAIAVGGGNTFVLLDTMYKKNLMGALKKCVEVDGIPYIGWSAGSGVAGPTIKTTNGMPILQPPSFNALNLTSFQSMHTIQTV
jgi:dipeptidase E